MNGDESLSVDAPGPGASPRLVARLRAAIDAAGGAISFAEYMELALYAPGLGYYDSGAEPFGHAGDFVTAPESGALFAGCAAVQAREVLAGMGDAGICEIGAGSGALAADLLAQLQADGFLPRKYLIVERSAALRERQRARLAARVPGIASRVQWRDRLPSAFRGLVLANEVLDAVPAHRFRVDPDGIRECRVTWRDGAFAWTLAEFPDACLGERVQRVVRALPHALPDHYVSEIAPARDAMVAAIGASLEEGLALIFDYGYPRAEYYHPQRCDGTLRCFHRHRAHGDALVFPGRQDLSVHVEFTALAEAAERAGLAVAGFTTQAEFLLATGLLDAARVVPPGSRGHAELTAQIKRLTLPGQMGEAVKVLALARAREGALTGFSGRDLRGRL